MIIDFHTHIFPPWLIKKRSEVAACDPLFAELYSNPKARLTSAEELIAEMDQEGITRSVVLNFAWNSHELCHTTNDYILESIARYPDRLIGFGTIKMERPEISIKEIERCIKGGIRGIGEVRPSRDLFENIKTIEPVILTLIENHLILLTHTSEPLGHLYPGKGDITPDLIIDLINTFPDLTMVCAHWGGGLPFYALMPEINKALKHVYFDCAASPFLYSPQVYQQVSSIIGSDKVLFGSDYPLLHPGRLLKEIMNSQMNEKQIEKILSGNAVKLLGVEDDKR